MHVARKFRTIRDIYRLEGCKETARYVARRLLGLSADYRKGLAWRTGGDALDQQLGIRTNEFVDKTEAGVPPAQIPDLEPHVPVHPRVFRHAIAATGITFADFVFVDIGSGLGRAVILANAFGFKRLIGVEISQPLNERAIENVVKVAQRMRFAPWELRHGNALDFDLPAEPLCVFLYRPFSHQVMAEFLQKLERSFRACPRPIVVVSVFLFKPAVFEHAPCLVRKKEVLHKDHLNSWQIYTTTPTGA